ncbi:MAG: Co2+/Mg2+ efflux protein ApaG [Myxococcales bacterium]|nr:Co2+/Mg2+ efflux protein ApaG [Myxococcales bacterium]MDD9969816.1 Co2+/Mg2+ efflux protein ApaG [Myxococcales bacterium]
MGPSEITNGIRVQVRPRFSPEHSDRQNQQWFFLYTVRISNEGGRAAQLLERHWIITNAYGQVEEVRGPGVVGQQPLLKPGESFEYTSGCPLETPFGTMEGTYRMVDSVGDHFDVVIPAFSLREPNSMQ